MSMPLWARRPLPAPGPGAATVGRWAPGGPADLTASRLQLSAALHGGARPAGATEAGVERLLLAFEELVSNALRHGRGAVEVTVTADGPAWQLAVSDAAADTPPTPAVGRDAALGGLGLYLVARLSRAHGWVVDERGRKIVWARVDVTGDEPPAEGRRHQPEYGHRRAQLATPARGRLAAGNDGSGRRRGDR